MSDMARHLFEKEQTRQELRRINRPEFTGILHLIQLRYPNSFIVGGAIRDWLNNVPINDIDIVVLGTEPIQGYNHLGLTELESKRIDEYISSCRFYGKYKEFTVDLFFRPDISNIDEFLSTLSLGICQVAFDGFCFIQRVEYLHDITNKQITVRNKTFSNKDDYLNKIHAKYPDFTIVK